MQNRVVGQHPLCRSVCRFDLPSMALGTIALYNVSKLCFSSKRGSLWILPFNWCNMYKAWKRLQQGRLVLPEHYEIATSQRPFSIILRLMPLRWCVPVFFGHSILGVVQGCNFSNCQRRWTLCSRPVLFNLFAKGSQIQIYNVVTEPQKRNFITIQLKHFVLYQIESIAQNLIGVIERLLRAPQRVLRSRMRLSEQWWEPLFYTVTCYTDMIYTRGHQPFRICELLFVSLLMRRATRLTHTSKIEILFNLPSVIVVSVFVKCPCNRAWCFWPHAETSNNNWK